MFYNLWVGEIVAAFTVAETAFPNPGNGGKGIFPEAGNAEDLDEDSRYSGHHVLQPAPGCDRAGIRRSGDHLPQVGFLVDMYTFLVDMLGGTRAGGRYSRIGSR